MTVSELSGGVPAGLSDIEVVTARGGTPVNGFVWEENKPYQYVEAALTIKFRTENGSVADETIEYEGIGMRRKGFFGSTMARGYHKPSLKLKLNEFADNSPTDGMNRFTLNNSAQDPSYMRVCMTFDLFNRAGVVAPRCSYVDVTVNDEHMGLYVSIDSPKEEWLEFAYGAGGGNVYEGQAHPDFQPGALIGWQKKTNEGEPNSDIEAIANAVALKDVDTIGQIVDLDNFITFWATETVLAMWDGYTMQKNNFWLYADPRDGDRIKFIPWSPDASWGQMADGNRLLQIVPESEAASTEGVLAVMLYSIPEYRDRYTTEIARVRDLLESGGYLAKIENAEQIIRPFLLDFDDLPFEPDIAYMKTRVQLRAAEVTAALAGRCAKDYDGTWQEYNRWQADWGACDGLAEAACAEDGDCVWKTGPGEGKWPLRSACKRDANVEGGTCDCSEAEAGEVCAPTLGDMGAWMRIKTYETYETMCEAECALWPFVGTVNGQDIANDLWFSDEDFTQGACPAERESPGRMPQACQANCDRRQPCEDAEAFEGVQLCGASELGSFQMAMFAGMNEPECAPMTQAFMSGLGYWDLGDEGQCACLARIMQISGPQAWASLDCMLVSELEGESCEDVRRTVESKPDRPMRLSEFATECYERAGFEVEESEPEQCPSGVPVCSGADASSFTMEFGMFMMMGGGAEVCASFGEIVGGVMNGLPVESVEAQFTPQNICPCYAAFPAEDLLPCNSASCEEQALTESVEWSRGKTYEELIVYCRAFEACTGGACAEEAEADAAAVQAVRIANAASTDETADSDPASRSLVPSQAVGFSWHSTAIPAV